MPQPLDYLITERRRQLGDVERRQQLRDRAKELKTDEGKNLHAVTGLKRRRAAIFQSAGCEEEQQYRMLAADGSVVWFRALVTVSLRDGHPVCWRGLMVDDTERRRAEEARREVEERNRATLRASTAS